MQKGEVVNLVGRKGLKTEKNMSSSCTVRIEPELAWGIMFEFIFLYIDSYK